jgi:drug/metabolite transporter (DMT)-like permease
MFGPLILDAILGLGRALRMLGQLILVVAFITIPMAAVVVPLCFLMSNQSGRQDNWYSMLGILGLAALMGGIPFLLWQFAVPRVFPASWLADDQAATPTDATPHSPRR